MVDKSRNNSDCEKVFHHWIPEVKKDLTKRGNFWTPTLITAPCHARTVVLRALDDTLEENSRSLQLTIHTDIRSKKWEQLQQSAESALHFYCSKRKWQMQIHTVASLCHQNDEATAEWEKLSSRSRQIYALENKPGIAVEDPKEAYSFQTADTGFEHFGVIFLQATSMESLQLERPDRTDYHVRAHWDLTSGRATYLAP